MRVGVIGVNHKLADLNLREKLAKACQKLCYHFQFNQDKGFFVVLSTCNRTEIYFSSVDLSSLHTDICNWLRQDIEEEFDQKLYSFFRTDCFAHLTKVASGLDSAILGETEILGQVKVAYENALNTNELCKDLHFLFQKAIAIAKKIRTTFLLSRDLPDLQHAILYAARRYFGDYKKARILFVGASDINRKVLEFLKNKNISEISLCNRTPTKAQLLAHQQNIQQVDWLQCKEWNFYDWIIFGTKSPEYLVKWVEIKQQELTTKKLIIDLSVPRNVDPEIGSHPNITLLNIDEINQSLEKKRSGLLHTVAEAENMITKSIHQHTLNYLQREQDQKLKQKALA